MRARPGLTDAEKQTINAQLRDRGIIPGGDTVSLQAILSILNNSKKCANAWRGDNLGFLEYLLGNFSMNSLIAIGLGLAWLIDNGTINLCDLASTAETDARTIMDTNIERISNAIVHNARIFRELMLQRVEELRASLGASLGASPGTEILGPYLAMLLKDRSWNKMTDDECFEALSNPQNFILLNQYFLGQIIPSKENQSTYTTLDTLFQAGYRYQAMSEQEKINLCKVVESILDNEIVRSSSMSRRSFTRN